MNKDHISGKNQSPVSVSEASNRPSLRREFEGEKTAKPSVEGASLGRSSIPLRGIPSSAAGAAPQKIERFSRAQLVEIESQLSARDHAVLMAIRKYRFLTSDQIGRLYMTECSTKTSRTRNQNLLLQRLADHGLIRPLERRVGGHGGGSTVKVWHLTEAGYRLLILNDPGEHPRKRMVEPSAARLAHTLAIAECAVQLTLLCRESDDLVLDKVDTEPSCWRKYKEDGRVSYLKPDMFAVTEYDGYEDHWFIEMDLGTEASSQIVEKCNIYLLYYYTGIEQRAKEVFPIVVWIAKDTARKKKLKEYIKGSIKAQPKLFLVITPDELEKMLRQMIGTEALC